MQASRILWLCATSTQGACAHHGTIIPKLQCMQPLLSTAEGHKHGPNPHAAALNPLVGGRGVQEQTHRPRCCLQHSGGRWLLPPRVPGATAPACPVLTVSASACTALLHRAPACWRLCATGASSCRQDSTVKPVSKCGGHKLGLLRLAVAGCLVSVADGHTSSNVHSSTQRADNVLTSTGRMLKQKRGTT